MPALRSLLCPVDFSEPSRHALRWARALARRTQGHLTVISAVDPLLAEGARLRFGLDLAHAETEPALRQFAAEAWSDDEAAPAPTATFDVRVGNPADVILDTAARERTDLIVMGTHGLGGVRHWLLGSTTERVLRRAHTPVLAVPPTAGNPVPLRDASGTLGPVLAATDFSDTSALALRSAAELAHEVGSPLLLVHVVEPIAVIEQWQPHIEGADQARVADARAQLDRLTKSFASSVACESLVETGRVADSIASIADQRRAGVIVMGLASSQGPLGSRPGSIAYRVLCLAKVPVLVVPPQVVPETPQQ